MANACRGQGYRNCYTVLTAWMDAGLITWLLRTWQRASDWPRPLTAAAFGASAGDISAAQECVQADMLLRQPGQRTAGLHEAESGDGDMSSYCRNHVPEHRRGSQLRLPEVLFQLPELFVDLLVQCPQLRPERMPQNVRCLPVLDHPDTGSAMQFFHPPMMNHLDVDNRLPSAGSIALDSARYMRVTPVTLCSEKCIL